MDDPQQPSWHEAALYYDGLPSRPKLIARSSTHPMRVFSDILPSIGGRVPKILQVVGSHPIGPLWNDSTGPLRQAIMRAVDGIDWTTIDILRLGYADESHAPVILFVSVKPGSTTWPQGRDVVMGCRRILLQHGLDDVHCEMKEGLVILAAPSPDVSESLTVPKLKLSTTVSERNQLEELEFSDHLGVAIASSTTPRLEGTKGPYLRADEGTFVLTCKHVVFDITEPNQREDYRHQSETPFHVIQPGKQMMDSILEDAKSDLDTYQCETNKIKESFAMTEEAKERSLKLWEDFKNASITHHQKMEALGQSDRTFGHVVASPKLDTRPTQSGEPWLPDWALIQLHEDAHEGDLKSIANRVFIGRDAAELRREVRRASKSNEQVGIPDLGLMEMEGKTVRLKGTIPGVELGEPEKTNDRTQPITKPPVPPIIVAKYGKRTGFTLGVGNGVKTVKRTPANLNFSSEEWCIVGVKPGNEKLFQAFSAPGDSGSCVWDLKGRIGGMLTSGSGQVDALDVTYAVPIERLLEHVKEYSGIDVSLA